MSDVKSFVRMFKPQFAGLVECGRKRQTVRPIPKRMPKPGDQISLRCWTGKPYRSKQRVLKECVITRVAKVKMVPQMVGAPSVRIDLRWLIYPDAHRFAVADGFATVSDMLAWFEENHGLPFEGIVIYWD